MLFATTFGIFRREFSPLRLCGGNHGGRYAFSGIAQAHSCRNTAVCAQPVAAVVVATARIAKPVRFARAVNQLQESSRRVRYLRATVEVSNSCKTLLLHDFGI